MARGARAPWGGCRARYHRHRRTGRRIGGKTGRPGLGCARRRGRNCDGLALPLSGEREAISRARNDDRARDPLAASEESDLVADRRKCLLRRSASVKVGSALGLPSIFLANSS